MLPSGAFGFSGWLPTRKLMIKDEFQSLAFVFKMIPRRKFQSQRVSFGNDNDDINNHSDDGGNGSDNNDDDNDDDNDNDNFSTNNYGGDCNGNIDNVDDNDNNINNGGDKTTASTTTMTVTLTLMTDRNQVLFNFQQVGIN